MTGSEALILSLMNEGVDTIFGYPGGAIMPVFDCLYDYREKLRHILVRHEQGAAHAAQGYARTSGKVGVALVTSGPGATNVITGIADAMIDSTPLVVITGQVASSLLGSDAFQEADVVGIAQPISKWSYQVRDAKDIPYAVAKAFYIASSGRPGPVILDITKDAQLGKLDFSYEKVSFIRSYQPKPDIDLEEVEIAAEIINSAKAPLVLVGQGVILGQAEAELKDFLEKSGIPAASTILGLSALPSDHLLNMGLLGMHGNIAPNIKTNECDVLIAIGMRFDDRVTGDLHTYAKQAKVIHFEIDAAEINKNVKVAAQVLGDVKYTLPLVNNLLDGKTDYSDWVSEFKIHYQKEYDTVIKEELFPDSGELKMGEVIHKVSEATNNNAILVTDVGQHQMMSVRYFKYKQSRSVVTSGGLGTMGFGLPAAIGAKFGCDNRTVCLFVGDGGFQMTLQELGTIMQYDVDIKIIILNNRFLGMVRQWQELFFDERYSETTMKNPDFIKIASAYNISALKVSKREDLDSAISDMLNHKGCYLLEVEVEAKGMVYPMVPSGSCITNILLGSE